MRRHGSTSLALLALATAACTKVNPNYCADAGKANGYACSAIDAGTDAPLDVVDATDVRESGDASNDVTEAAVERPTCTNATCATAEAPICDVDAGMCRVCATDGECVGKGTMTPACDNGQCYACKTDDHCTDAAKPICDAHACRGCGAASECATRSAATPACASSGSCVQCTASSDCKVPGMPVCNTSANTCRACLNDAECPADPGVCMADGHCATTGEVIFVEFNAAGCTAADGTSANPYCAPNDGVAHLGTGHNVIVLRGASGDRMTLNTSGLSPIVIGRKSTSNGDGSVPATAATAISVSSDTVLIRDLNVNAGTAPTSKGIAVTGASTKLTLLRVTASLGTGLGIDAESGSSLTMDECYVLNNSTGGILVNGAAYSIQNTVIAGNGYGIQFSAPLATNAQLRFNTVVNNPVAATCDLTSTETFTNSIITGPMVNCNVVDSVTTAPTFSTTRPFHLTAHLACPTAPAAGTFPDHDIDGDSRTGAIDCGADQFQ
jgi:hypothetical protein